MRGVEQGGEGQSKTFGGSIRRDSQNIVQGKRGIGPKNKEGGGSARNEKKDKNFPELVHKWMKGGAEGHTGGGCFIREATEQGALAGVKETNKPWAQGKHQYRTNSRSARDGKRLRTNPTKGHHNSTRTSGKTSRGAIKKKEARELWGEDASARS